MLVTSFMHQLLALSKFFHAWKLKAYLYTFSNDLCTHDGTLADKYPLAQGWGGFELP